MFQDSRNCFNNSTSCVICLRCGGKLIVWSLRSIWVYRFIQNINKRPKQIEICKTIVLYWIACWIAYWIDYCDPYWLWSLFPPHVWTDLGLAWGAKGPGPDRLGFGLGAKGPGPDRLGFGLGGQGSWAGPAWFLIFRRTMTVMGMLI